MPGEFHFTNSFSALKSGFMNRQNVCSSMKYKNMTGQAGGNTGYDTCRAGSLTEGQRGELFKYILQISRPQKPLFQKQK